MPLKNSEADNLRQHIQGACHRVNDQLEHIERTLAKNPGVWAELEARYGKEEAAESKAVVNALRDLLGKVRDDVTKERIK